MVTARQITAFMLCLGFSACSAQMNCSGPALPGSGQAKTVTRPISGAVKVRFGAVGTLNIRQGAAESLTITADDNLLPLLESTVTGGVLSLGVAKGQNLAPRSPIVYDLVVTKLESLALLGAGRAVATELDCERLELKIGGVGSVTVRGRAEELVATLSGVGALSAQGLECRRARVLSSGVGSSVVKASEELDVVLSGVGSVEYIGAPKLTKRVTGLGSVRAQVSKPAVVTPFGSK